MFRGSHLAVGGDAIVDEFCRHHHSDKKETAEVVHCQKYWGLKLAKPFEVDGSDNNCARTALAVKMDALYKFRP